MSEKRIFPLIAVMYLVMVTALIMRVPPGSAPDEVAHIDYVKYIVTQRTLPIFTGAAPPDYGYEFHQPPLYYALCAPGAWLFQGDTLFLWCRAVAALCGLGVIALIWRAARSLFPEREDFAIFAAAVAAVWPLHLGVSASAGNDALAGFFCAALFYLVARGAGDGWQPRHAILAGVCAGLGLWTKTTTLPASIVALGVAWDLSRRGWAARGLINLSAPVTMILAGALVAMPLFIRNQLLYGDPLGWQVFSRAASSGTPGYEQMSAMMEAAGLSLSFVQYMRGILLMIFCTAWGLYGGPDNAVRALKPLAESPRPFAGELVPFASICALATLIVLMGTLHLRDDEAMQGQARVLVARWWLCGVIFITLAWAQFAYAHFSGGQARYLHPAILPVCVMGAAAWNTILQGKIRIVFAVLFWLALVSLILMNVFGWRTLV